MKYSFDMKFKGLEINGIPGTKKPLNIQGDTEISVEGEYNWFDMLIITRMFKRMTKMATRMVK